MKDERKTKAELIEELKELRRQIKQQKSNSAKIGKNSILEYGEMINRAVIENSPLGISIRSSKRKLLSVNRAWKKIWNFSDEQVDELMKEDPEKLNFAHTRQSLGEWLPKVEKIYKEGGSLHIPRLLMTIKIFNIKCWISLTYYAINNDKGDVDRVIILTEDITERINLENDILESQSKYRSVIENANIGVLVIQDNRLVFYNSKMYEMFGYSEQDYSKINFLSTVHPDDQPKTVERIKARLSGLKIDLKPLEIRVICKSGEIKWIKTNSSVIHWDNRPALQAFICDITETKHLREQESRALRLESAGRVAGQIAHDFNNLLAPLVAYPDFIKEGLPANHPTLKYINDMEKSANQIAEINQQLLTLSRRGHYNQEILNLNEVIQFAIEEMGILPQTVVIETNFARNLMNIKGGASQINRILFNLIHNARDAMQDVGNICIKTENYYADNPTTNFGYIPKGEYIKVTISDIGCGIPEDICLNIFEPFFTTKSSDKRRGSGLGLSVVDAVMKDHDGYIDLQSSVGDGTSFYLYFPITRETIDSACEDEILGGTESILIVDDDKTQCDVALKLLKKLGYNATAINSGEQTVKYLKKNPQDLLLLDMIMPDGIDGTETFRQVIEMYPNQKAIIVSGYAESSRVEEARQLGIEMYIRKPLTLKLVASCIRKVLDKKEIPATTV
ncbi:MAG: hypothetical protein DRP51_08295 [Candidatus Zixiibacteriota bacterium]|nr:MAG: hypothetical protein DRP51_08295 [candidate division Zixibacteria bacterium]